MTDGLAMAHGDRTDLNSLAATNRAAARLLKAPEPVARAIALPGADSIGSPKSKAFPVLLRTTQIFLVAGCIWAADRLVLDNRLSNAIGGTLQVGSMDLRIMAQKLIYRIGF